MTRRSRRWMLLSIAVAIACLTLPPVATQARTIRTAEVADQVYAVLPQIPLENGYHNHKLNKVDPKNTLINRLLRYHLYTKGRPVEVRLDWKLTIADYLNANDIMDPATYPGNDVLKENPMENDRRAIDGLSRQLRDRLIDQLLQATRR